MSGITGEKLAGIVRGEALSGGLALGQSKIGDIGVEQGLEPGSASKVAMHSIAGGIYSASTGASALSGAIGGATSELVAGMMNSGTGLNSPPSLTADATTTASTTSPGTTTKPLTPEQAKTNAQNRAKLNSRIQATTKLTTAAATLLTGGRAKDINTAVNVGTSAIEHNHKNHFGLLANREAETAEEVAALDEISKLDDETLTKQYKESTSGIKGLVPIFMKSARNAAIECEYNDRFVDDTRTELAKLVVSDPTASLVRFTGIVVEKATGKDLGMATISEPDFTGSRFGMPKKSVLKSGARDNSKNSASSLLKPPSQDKTAKPVKTAKKNVVKSEQPWKIREGQEYKKKIYGKAQKSTPGHDTRSYREAIKAAKSKDVESVHLNQGMKKSLEKRKAMRII